MLPGKLQAPPGTFDVLPEEGLGRRELYRRAGAVLGRAGYRPFDTPAMEDAELFARGVGESTDIVQKEMFTFEDMGGRSLALRPEATAGVCRAYVQHGMHKDPQPVKLWTWGPFFRHERPQAGRYRQFTQVDVEALGSDDPSLDAESVLLLAELLEAAGVRECRLRLSSLGTAESRAAYLEELRSYLREHDDRLSPEVRARIEQNPLRAFDADHEDTRAVMGGAPRLLDRLAPEDAEHFAAVRALLDDVGLAHEVDTTLVRGLDYYTRTVFEFTSDALGAQSGVGGGGRYDGLIEQLGGKATPGCGWAAGVERMLMCAQQPATAPPPVDLYVAGEARPAFKLAADARRFGHAARVEQAGRSMKGVFKQADRIGARYVAIVGADGQVELKDMQSGDQQTVPLDTVMHHISGPGL